MRTSKIRKSRRPARRRPWLETLEDRTLLSVTVPAAVDPSQATQALFGTDMTRQEIVASHLGTENRLFQFALDGQSFNQAAEFDLAPTDPNSTADGALGVFDSDGNLLASANAKPTSFETLTTTLQTHTVYVLGVFFESLGPLNDLQLTVSPGPQVTNTPLTIDPTTGTASLAANSGEDIFNSPTDVDYYPLNLTNAGPAGSVTVTPTGPDVEVAATVFRRNNSQDPWQSIASSQNNGQSTPVTLPLSPPTGRNLSDAQYLLTVAPQGFNTPAGAYQIDMAATSVLAPATVDPTAATKLLTPPPVSLGVAQVQAAGKAAPTLYKFRAPANGTATIALGGSSQKSQVAIYDATGTQLLHVGSQTHPGSFTFPLPVSAGAEYVLRIADIGILGGPSFVTVTTPYEPTPLHFIPNNTAAAGAVLVGPSQGAKYYEVNLAPETDVLSIQVNPTSSGTDPVAAELTIVGLNGSGPISIPAVPAGQTLFLSRKVTGQYGPLDIYVAGVSGSDPVDVQVGQLQVPLALTFDQLTRADLGLNGKVASVSQQAGKFGNRTGIVFDQLATDSSDPTTLTVTGTGGTQPLLAHYQQNGSQLLLVDFALPNNQEVAQLQEPLTEQQLQGVAAYTLDFSGAGNPQETAAFSTAGPIPHGVGVGMVPDLAAQSQNPPVYQSVLKIRNVTLSTDYHQHLWRTILPYNLNGAPVMVFTPAQPQGALQVQVSIYDGTDPNNPQFLEQGTSPAHGDLQLTLTQSNLGGHTLLFLVQPLPGKLGDGIYTLTMTVPTTNPNPFEVMQTAWSFADNPATGIGTTPNDAGTDDGADVGTIPANEPIVDIVQNQFGHGEAEGNFTNSDPNGDNPSLGEIDVYRFWAINPGPVSVKTVAEDGSLVNTNLRVYRTRYGANGALFLGQLTHRIGNTAEHANFNLDWYLADRSQIDAQSYVNDFDLFRYSDDGDQATFGDYVTGGGMYYVVVRNQEGSQGKYRIEVNTADFPLLGGQAPGTLPINEYRDDAFPNGNANLYNPPIPAVPAYTNQAAYIPADGGTVELKLNYIETFRGFVGYFPVQLPNYHNGALTITSQAVSGIPNVWRFDVFDAQGNPLPGASAPVPLGQNGAFTVGNFTVPGGAQTVYLRVQEQGDLDAFANLFVSATATPPLLVSPPPATLGPVPVSTLPTSPLGDALQTLDHNGLAYDGRLHDALTSPGQSKTYEFQAPAGALTITVTPPASSALMRWGAYVNGNLVAWGAPGFGAGDTTFVLPSLRQPLESPDADYDTAPYQDVLLVVQGLGNTTGGFTVAVHGNAVLPVHEKDLADKPVGKPGKEQVTTPAMPMFNNALAIGSLTGFSASIPTSALQWLRLSVPCGATGSLALQVDPGTTPAGDIVEYNLYDAAGLYVTSGSAPVPTSQFVNFNLPEAAGGTSYYLRIGLRDFPDTSVNVTAGINLPKTSLAAALPSPTIANFLNQPLVYPDMSPDGHSVFGITGSPLVPVWVGQGGQAHFAMVPGLGQNMYLALYRASFDFNGEMVENFGLELVDYQNMPVLNSYTIDAYVSPGLYVLQVGGTASPSMYITLPAYLVEDLVLDPNTGTNNTPELRATDRGAAETRILESFRTRFYHVVTPAGSLDGLTAHARNLTTEGPFPENRNGTLFVWTQSTPGGFLQVPDFLNDHLSDPNGLGYGNSQQAVVMDPDATPLTDFWLSFRREAMAGEAGVMADFTVPLSGDPDLVVTSLNMLPDNGQTRVEVTVQNRGFAPAGENTARYEFSDATKQPDHLTTADLDEQTLGPFASRTRSYTWHPQSPADHVSYTTDFVPNNPKGIIEETDETNNSKMRTLSEVDANYPVVTQLALADPSMSLNPDPNVWGRYVEDSPFTNPNFSGGPRSDILISIQDPDNDIYAAVGELPFPGAKVAKGSPFTLTANPNQGSATFTIPDFKFFQLLATGPDNPNLVKVHAVDTYGLESGDQVRTVQVVPQPRWIQAPAGTFTWDATNRMYHLHFLNALVDLGDPNHPLQPILTATLLGDQNSSDVPLIGDTENRFIVEVDADVPATLDPTPNLSSPVHGKAELEIVGQDVFNEEFNGTGKINDHITFSVSLAVNGLSLEATDLAVSFQFSNYDIFNYESPEIPIYSYGIPEVLNLNINLKFLVDVVLNAAVTVGLDPNILNNPLNPAIPLDLLAPTFIEPSATVSGHVSGEAQIIGIDAADIYGSVDFTLDVIFGLDAAANTPVPLTQFFGDPIGNTAVTVNGELAASFGADILGFNVWSFSTPDYTFNIANTAKHGGVITTLPDQTPAPPVPDPVSLAGDQAVGAINTDPRPNVVIDSKSGAGLYVQVADADPNNPALKRGNLVFERRPAGPPSTPWSAQNTLTQPENVANPVLALTHDQADPSLAPAVVVYQTNLPDPTQTFNHLLTSQEIRSRYYDGNSWHDEQALTTDSLYDTDPVVAFNQSGAGVVAWTRNTNPMPMTTQLDRNHNEIAAAVWDPVNHAWLPMQLLTNDGDPGVPDSKPAVFAGADGTLYVTWVRDEGGAGKVMVSMYKNGTWSTPAELPTIGLPANGQINGLALGSEGIDPNLGVQRLDLLMSYADQEPDGTTASHIYSRPSTSTNFLSAQPLETIAEGATFSHVRTTNDAQGNLIAYWQQSDGVTNDVFAASLGVAGSGAAWSVPMKLSTGQSLQFTPSVAVDSDGTFQSVFTTRQAPETPLHLHMRPPGPDAQPVGMAVSGRVGTSSVRPLPELGFSQALTFPGQDRAVSGSQADANAQILNSGLVGTHVQIDYFDGVPPNQGGLPLASQVIYLAPGHSYDVTHDFFVLPGPQTYSVRLTDLDYNQEVLGTNVHVASASLTGLADVAVTSVVLSDPHPIEGETVQVTATVANLSNLPVNTGFAVAFTQGDPRFASPVNPVTQLGTTSVAFLPGNGQEIVTFPWTVPSSGQFTLAAEADSGQVLNEVTRGNNIGRVSVDIEPDAAIAHLHPPPPPVGDIAPLPTPSAVTATVLDYSGKDNVEVHAAVSNLGYANLHNVRVELFRSLDDGPFKSMGFVNVLSLPARSETDVRFLASGLAGHNRYRAVVDPASALPDSNRSNNVGETVLFLQGLPDLVIPDFVLNPVMPNQGEPVMAHVHVANQDIGGADQIRVELFDGNPALGGLLLGGTTLAHLDPLSDTYVDFPIDSSHELGPVELWAIVDRPQLILESSDLNNTMHEYATFLPPDTTPPVCSIQPLPALIDSSRFLVQWQAHDPLGPDNTPGSGVALVEIFAQDGDQLSLWQTQVADQAALDTSGSAYFDGIEGHTYSFFCIAIDRAGNREPMPSTPDATTTIRPPSGEIHGSVFHDLNSNHSWDSTEPPLAGWTVFLDQNHNGMLDPGEVSTTTDASGAYAFTGLPAGSYTVAEVLQNGWVQTYPGGLLGDRIVEDYTAADNSGPGPINHFLPPTSDLPHFAWQDEDPSTPNVIDIYYDFRPIGPFANQITFVEKTAARIAFEDWSDASQGRLRFVQNTTAPLTDIINVGTGDLAALGGTSAPGGILALGGATASTDGRRTLSAGVAWLDAAENWATTYAASNPANTYDYRTVVEHEIGHALGVGHLQDLLGPNIMDGFYEGAMKGFSPNDQAVLQAIYPVAPPPPPESSPLTPLPGSHTVPLGDRQIVSGENFGNHYTLPPAPPTNLAIQPDRGASPTDGLTNTGMITLSGSIGNPDILGSPLRVHVFDESAGGPLGDAMVSGTSFAINLNLTEGRHHLRVQAENADGNISTASFFDVFIDLTPPRIISLMPVTPSPRTTPVSTVGVAFTEPIDPATLNFHALTLTRDGGPNLMDSLVTITPILIDTGGSLPSSQATYSINGLDNITMLPGHYVLTVDPSRLADFAGNPGAGSALSDDWITQSPTTTALSSSANPSDYGQKVTLTALVTAGIAGSGIPTGTVTFLDGSTPLGTGTLDATGQASFTTAAFALASGNHPLTASYGGDSHFLPSTAPVLTEVVLSAQEQIGMLVNQVRALVAGGTLNSGNGNALTVKLNNALASLNNGNTNAGINQLSAFINQVNGLKSSGALPAAQAQAFVNAANQAIVSARGPAGAFQLMTGAVSNYVVSDSNQITNGILTVAVQDDTGNGLDPNEIARLDDSVTYLNAALGSFGVQLSWAAPGTDADVHIHFASTTPRGGAGDGVLGFTTATNDVYFVTGWNFYTGTDIGAVAANQFDFQTLSTHELAHTVGLGESIDPDSVMYEYLSMGSARRAFTESNLQLINTDADRFMKVAGGFVDADSQAPVLAVAAARGSALAGQDAAFARALSLLLQNDLSFAQSFEPVGRRSFLEPMGGENNVLIGGAGDDVLIGGRGQDILCGGFGKDDTCADIFGAAQVAAERHGSALSSILQELALGRGTSDASTERAL
jgi:hypothetical protein